MNGTLHHHDIYREAVERHQQEARDWATVDRMARVARASRAARVSRYQAMVRRSQTARLHAHSVRARVRALRMHLHAWTRPHRPHPHHH